ncbi:MAG: hypothetical protein LUG60_01640 [Erysipelotrichaceae bacterium]|nr:hypothetical protein [Erysipelotrichaceae bacterium]
MDNLLNNESFKHLILLLLNNANDTLKMYRNNPKDHYYAGKKLGYYEILDTLKNRLETREEDLKEYGLDDVDKFV